MKLDKRIIILLVIIIAILSAVLAYQIFYTPDNAKTDVKNITANNTTAINATMDEEKPVSNSESGKYGYCAICGKALTKSEATNEYTQGKVCADCASNPYYESGPGAEYANRKLYEAYPDEYAWMYEDTGDSYDDSYDDYDYDDYDYSNYDDYDYEYEDEDY